MKVLQVAAGLDEPGAGPSYSVRRLAQALEAQGESVELHSVLGWRGPPLDTPGPSIRRHRQDAVGVPVLQNLCLSGSLRRALSEAARSAQILHTHGLWLMPNVYPAAICHQAGIPFVLSPRGMLGTAALEFSRLKKQAFWAALQGPAARSAACLHATSEAEYVEIRAQGLTNPVVVVPNGVDVPPTIQGPVDQVRTAISLGRLHPKKGLPNLIDAWAAVEARFPAWRLRIIGPDELGHAAELAARARALNLTRVSIEGPLYGQDRLRALRSASLFVLPTLNENFAMTVAEALAAGLPAIVTRGAPWSGLDAKRCGWWIEGGVAPLAEALDRTMSLAPTELAEMGDRGRRWMAHSYGWTSVASAMSEVYRWLAGQTEIPPHVRLD